MDEDDDESEPALGFAQKFLLGENMLSA